MEMDEKDAAQKLHMDMQQDVITCPMPAGSVLLMNAHSKLLTLFLHSTECALLAPLVLPLQPSPLKYSESPWE